MRKLFAAAVLSSGLLLGCASDHPSKRVEAPVNVTHEQAFGDYRRVFNTTYHILNRYGVIRTSSYSYGEITALVSEDNSLYDKTRREIEARIFDAGDYYEVECRVLIKIEDSEPATFQDQFNPRYSWKTVASDSLLETRLNNEIREALSGGAWQAKEPLRPKAREPFADSPKKSKKSKKGSKATPAKKKTDENADEGNEDLNGTDEVANRPTAQARLVIGAEAYERMGVKRMRRGLYASAIKAFEAAQKSSKDERFVHFLLAQARFSQGSFSESLRSLRTGVVKNPQWLESDVDVRAFYGPGLKTFPKRLAELKRAAKQDASLHLLLGYMRLFSDDAEGGLVSFDSYLASNANDPNGKSLRAEARKRVDSAHGVEDF